MSLGKQKFSIGARAGCLGTRPKTVFAPRGRVIRALVRARQLAKHRLPSTRQPSSRTASRQVHPRSGGADHEQVAGSHADLDERPPAAARVRRERPKRGAPQRGRTAAAAAAEIASLGDEPRGVDAQRSGERPRLRPQLGALPERGFGGDDDSADRLRRRHGRAVGAPHAQAGRLLDASRTPLQHHLRQQRRQFKLLEPESDASVALLVTEDGATLSPAILQMLRTYNPGLRVVDVAAETGGADEAAQRRWAASRMMASVSRCEVVGYAAWATRKK